MPLLFVKEVLAWMRLEENYIRWLIKRIREPGIDWSEYTDLLYFLYSTDFTWFETNPSIAMDRNRAMDGVDLRRTYDDDHGTHIELYLRECRKECSVLEMMIALAIRIEDDVMWEGGRHRYGYWFMKMLENLGLDRYTDSYGRLNQASIAVNHWLRREYGSDGKWCMFCNPKNKTVILSLFPENLEIWRQVNNWLIEEYGD